MKKIQRLYGSNVQIMGHKAIRTGLIFHKEGVELNGYVRNEPPAFPLPGIKMSPAAPKPQILDPQQERDKILTQGGKVEKVMDKVLLQKIYDKLNGLGEKLEAETENKAVEHPTVTKIESLLKENDFSHDYARKIIERIRKTFSLEQLGNYPLVEKTVLEWIGEDISIFPLEVRPDDAQDKKPRIIALIGPTGVGKTTTIAKLAAIYGPLAPQNPSQNVRLITIDNYRIAAREQLERYGQWMHVPVQSVKSNDDLKKYIALNSEGTDLFLVDTIGRSPRKPMELAEMKDMLSACPHADYHLVIDAKTKTSDIAEIMQDFEVFGYKSVLVTKMDESSRPGNIISLLCERGKPVSYVTTGQNVPRDIEKANPLRFLLNLEGFTIDRRSMEKKFGKIEGGM
jgi:flagellar biosynthesis protein FlhF